jgi:hypothetical protein
MRFFKNVFVLVISVMSLNLMAQSSDSSKSISDTTVVVKTDSVVKKDSVVRDFSSYRIPIRYEIVDGDTFPVYQVDETYIRKQQDPDAKKRYLKMVRDVKKAMPYAKLAAFRMQMMEDNLALLKTKRARKKYIKACEESIKKEFMDDLKNLTRRQGIYLMKLIHRETGKSTWEIMKNYRGGASALFWETMASFYGASMKVEYDPITDHTMEYIIESYNLE